MPVMEYRIPADMNGKTVYQAVVHGLMLSTGLFKRAKFHGLILLDETPVHADVKVHTDQILRLEIPEKENTLPQFSANSLNVFWEDEHILVIDKPAPLPTASSSRQDGETLENRVYTWLGCPDPFVYRPINRLDKGTSGLMIVAKTAHAQHLTQQLLHSSDFIREYLAVIDGQLPEKEGMINLPIGKANGSTIRREVREDGKPSRTWYQVLQNSGKRSLVRLRLDTGRTHQIRVHMSAHGCPVTGDFLYGTESNELPGRFALHSTYLRLIHPITGEEIQCSSPLPQELQKLL